MKEIEIKFKPNNIFKGEKYAKICTSKAYFSKIYKLMLKIDDYTVKELNSDDFYISKTYDGFTKLKDISDDTKYLFYRTDDTIIMKIILL